VLIRRAASPCGATRRFGLVMATDFRHNIKRPVELPPLAAPSKPRPDALGLSMR
jgi:hypothetical protein